MTKEEKQEVSEEAEEETQEAPEEEAPDSTSDETPEEDAPEEQPKEDAPEEQPKEDIDYKKELETLEENTPQTPPKRSEKEKAEFTLKKIHERFPDLKPEEVETEEGSIAKVEQNLLRQQVEGIIRANSKTEDEVKYKMFYYDNKVVKSGNIHEDADDAMWLANKNRTKNAIKEMKRKPTPGQGGGTGQKTPISGVIPLSEQDQLRMKQLGLKQTAPDKWEGEKMQMVFNKQNKKWEDSRK